jgi:hypothetical protein
MERKECVLQMVSRLPDDVTLDRILYHLDVLRRVEIGLEQADREEGTEHEELFRRLEKEWQKESKSAGRQTPRKNLKTSGAKSQKTPSAGQTR